MATDDAVDWTTRFRRIQEYLAKGSSPVKFTYLAEGGANAVFKINIPTSAEDESLKRDLPIGPIKRIPSLCTGVLIRVPLATPGVNAFDYPRQQQYRETRIEPVIGEFLVPQLLIELSLARTQQLDQARDPDSTKWSKIRAGHAFLIKDMGASGSQLGFEFKPKWLAQSPIAPEGATRCRNCAREARRNMKLRQQGKSISPPVCPLRFVHEDPDVRLGAYSSLIPDWSKEDQQYLADAVSKTQILTRLRDSQVQKDPGNAMFENPEDEDFRLAMTLRDCSCYVRVSRQQDGQRRFEIALADLDEKNWREKQHYWQESHDQLVNEGFYFESEEPYIFTDCLLSPLET